MSRFELNPEHEEALQRQVEDALQARIQAAIDATIRAWRDTDLKNVGSFLRRQLEERGMYELGDDWIANVSEQIATGRIEEFGADHDRPAHGD